MPRLSICIAARNEAINITECVLSGAFADEVLVLDSASTDGTAELACAAGARAPQRRSGNVQHGHDLRLGHATVQTRQHMGTIDLARVMNTLRANPLDDGPIAFAQMHFRLAHEY